MRLPRQIITLLCAFCLVAAPSTALAQSAGDEQYQDPLGPGTTQSQQDTPTQDGVLTPDPDPGATLTDEPQLTPDITDPGDLDDLDDVPQDTTNRPERLADTGIDTRLFLALGASLLLAGTGLRLRTIPERF